MTRKLRGVLALGLFGLLFGVAAVHAQDEMVENPKYKFWANFKQGATSTYKETTKLGGPDKDNLPGGLDVKTVVYKLANVSKNKVIVTTTVTEEEFLGSIEAAPTRLHYPAKISKANLEAVFQEFGDAKPGEDETVKIGDKEIKCKVLAGTAKKGSVSIEYKLYYSETVPGGIVKRSRVTKAGDKLIAETTITLTSFGDAPPPKVKKEKDKKEKDKE